MQALFDGKFNAALLNRRSTFCRHENRGVKVSRPRDARPLRFCSNSQIRCRGAVLDRVGLGSLRK